MRRPLVILITNIWFAHAGGSEVVVRDLSLGMLRRGHRPVVYAPRLGGLAEDVAQRGVTIIDDLAAMAEPPDIIHAHHVIPAGEALIRFPGVPAINVCHGFRYWLEGPVHFPAVGAYVGVDEACRDRLVHQEAIAPERVVILQNAVDLRRIPPRPRPLGSHPQRAIVFGKAAGIREIRDACAAAGIACDELGAGVGRISTLPEHELIQADLVFGSARAALEGLCCGCAVIVCDGRGMAGLVTSQNYAGLRARNFGLRCLAEPVTVDRCLAEIARYDAGDAAAVGQRARREADLEMLLDAFEALYEDVLSGPRRPHITAEAHARAITRFLHDNLPRLPEDSRWPCVEREHLQRQLAALERQTEERTAGPVATPPERLHPGPEMQPVTPPDPLIAQLIRERDEAHRASHEVKAQLAELRRSRALKIGRLIRRITRRPLPY
jgi:hypothetical protein